MRGLLAWLRSFAVHTFRGGEDQIAVSIRGKEAIYVDDWRKLPEEERDEWDQPTTRRSTTPGSHGENASLRSAL